MSQFTENVSISPLPKDNLWITTAPLVYHVGDKYSDDIITVPALYTFDGASVPMVFGMFIQRVEPSTISPACLHDRLYTKGRRGTQREADKIFYEALLVSGVPKWKAMAMYMGVRLGGRLYRHKIV